MKKILIILLSLLPFVASAQVIRADSTSKFTLEEWIILCSRLTGKAALVACEQAIKLDPKQEKLWLYKGDAFYSMENYLQAAQAYDQAITLNKSSAINWRKKGEALAASQLYPEATTALNQAFVLNPKDNLISLDRGIIFFLQNKELEARKYYDQFLANKSLDLVLLSKVIDNTIEKFKLEKPYKSVTNFIIFNNTNNKASKIDLISQNTIKSSKLFDSEIEVAQDGNILSQLHIIGDGEKIWAYRPDLQQYTFFSYDEFISGDKLIFTGLYNFFFLSIPEFKQAKFALIRTLLESSNISSFSQEIDIVEGRKYTVYKYQIKDKEPFFQIWIDSSQNSITQLQFRLESSEIQMKITEKISSPIEINQSFKYIPPKGAKLVKELPNIYRGNLNLFH